MFKPVAAALVALSVVSSSAAVAEGRHESYGHRAHWERHAESYDRDHHHDRFHAGPYRHHHYWHRGERLPVAYYAPPYIVRDYHAYHLSRPPRGCHWVRVDGDAVLAAIATGVVLDVLYDRF
jgi:Ni/Co efflux regulator RcnB